MLMRYAQHLAGGHGIVWNIGAAPVDGATDFLFMTASAAFIKMGFTVGQSVRGIGLASHIFTVLIIYWTNRRIHGGSVPGSLLSGLYLVFGTGLSYVSAYFGTPFFALGAACTWSLGLLLINKKDSPLWLTTAFAFSGLVTGLIRPEGVILSTLMLIAIVVMRGIKKSISILLIFGLVFAVFGGAYFFWRWDYFGYPLPNPFYKKGDSGWKWDSFHHSLQNTLRLGFPMVFAFLLGFRSKETTRRTIAYLIPILGFASAFGLISDEMNYGARFQYAILPIALMSWIPLSGEWNPDGLNQLTGRQRRAVFAGVILLAGSLIYYSWTQNCQLTSYQQTCNRPYERDGRLEMAKMLAEYRGRGYILATTEAGLLPYYSGWDAVDVWGLNDQWIAHHGAVTAEYLDGYQPHIIMFHDYYSTLVPPKLTEANLAQRWFGMTILLKTYAEDHGYVLAAIFGDSPYDTHYYYVRPDFEDSAEIVERISEMTTYYYPTTGKKSINYAAFPEP